MILTKNNIKKDGKKMSSKLDILREYNEDIQLINANEFKNINSSLIPDLWVEVFSEHDREKRIKKILSIWKNM